MIETKLFLKRNFKNCTISRSIFKKINLKKSKKISLTPENLIQLLTKQGKPQKLQLQMNKFGNKGDKIWGGTYFS